METSIPVGSLPKLNTTPLPEICIAKAEVQIEVDDVHERRIRLVFQPYQAVSVTTADCFDPPGEGSMIPNTVVEITHSRWIERLKAQQQRIDETAGFLEKARHFVIPLQDDFAEVVAWEVRWELVE
jgi:hypothetical protein